MIFVANGVTSREYSPSLFLKIKFFLQRMISSSMTVDMVISVGLFDGELVCTREPCPHTSD